MSFPTQDIAKKNNQVQPLQRLDEEQQLLTYIKVKHFKLLANT